MTEEQAKTILRWHAENSTAGGLAHSVRCDVEWEEAYRTLFGAAPSHVALQEKIKKGSTP